MRRSKSVESQQQKEIKKMTERKDTMSDLFLTAISDMKAATIVSNACT